MKTSFVLLATPLFKLIMVARVLTEQKSITVTADIQTSQQVIDI